MITVVVTFSIPSEVLRIVGKLHNSDTELFEQFDVTRVLFERGTILKTKNNARFVGFLGPGNVGRSTYFQQQIVVVPEMPLPGCNIVHCRPETFPYRAGAVGGSHTATPHVFKNGPRKLGNNQSIDYDEVLV